MQRYSKDLAFQVLKFSIHKPTSNHCNFSVYALLIPPPFQYEKRQAFEERLCNRGYSTALALKILAEVHFSDRAQSKTKKDKEILLFVTTYNPATPNLKKILMKH